MTPMKQAETLIVEEVFNPSMVKAIYKELIDTRKCTGDDQFIYTPIERSKDGKTYTIEATHIPLGEVLTYAKSSCNKCYGSGKRIQIMGKDQIQNTDDFMLLSSTPIKGLTDEQRNIVIEKEKQSKTWRVFLPCPCTIKGMVKNGRHIVSNELNNIIAEITCTEKLEA